MTLRYRFKAILPGLCVTLRLVISQPYRIFSMIFPSSRNPASRKDIPLNPSSNLENSQKDRSIGIRKSHLTPDICWTFLILYAILTVGAAKPLLCAGLTLSLIKRGIHVMEKKASHFSGQLGFVLAKDGSGVGVGNLWRFSYLVAK